MKKYCQAITAFLLFTLPANAQYKWSAGYQLMLGNSSSVHSSLTGETNEEYGLAPTNQMFINRKLGKKFQVELSLGYTLYTNRNNYTQMNHLGGISFQQETITKNNIYNFTFTAKYLFYQKERFIFYIPATINNIYSRSSTSTTGTITNNGSVNNKITLAQNILAGIGTQFNLNKRVYLDCRVLGGYNLNKATHYLTEASNSTNYFPYGLQAGLGYSF